MTEKQQFTLRSQGLYSIGRIKWGSCTGRDPVQVGIMYRWGTYAGGGHMQVGIMCRWGTCADGNAVQVGILFRWGTCAGSDLVQVGIMCTSAGEEHVQVGNM